MWKSFFQSIALLAISLTAALYSASAAQEGQVTEAGVAALVALAIALWVGIRFVPRLARGVDWRWLPLFSQYKITRDGIIFVVALLIVLAAAVNTANNLLYMVLSSLLAVLSLSAFLSAMNFRFLSMELQLPERAFAGEAFAASVTIHNRKRVFPAFSLTTEPQESSLYFTAIHPGTSVTDWCEVTLPRRGRYTIKRLRTASRFPFGLFTKMLEYKVNAECVCYPAILPQEQMDLSFRDIHGSRPRFERGLGFDLYTIRDYQPSDSARLVHWKASAKTSTLKTREFAAEDTTRVVIAFDRFGKPHEGERFEQRVSWAASLAFHLIRNGVEVILASDEWESPAGNSEAVLDGILHYLALVEMSASAPPPAVDPESGALLVSLRPGQGRS
jgi:uncharacterized protein (DUF58 family)